MKEKTGDGGQPPTNMTIPFPTKTPAQRLERDLYSAIVGHPPVIDPTLAVKESMDAPKPVGDLARAWSPVNFCLELRRACVDNLLRHAQRQQVTDFIRRVGHNATRQIVGPPNPKFVRSRVANEHDKAA
jgi:hypothetical protein